MKKLLKIIGIVIAIILLLAVIGSLLPEEETTIKTTALNGNTEKISIKETHGNYFSDEHIMFSSYEASRIDTASLRNYCLENTENGIATHWFLFYKPGAKQLWLEGMDTKEQIMYNISKACPDLIIATNYGESPSVMDCEWFKP